MDIFPDPVLLARVQFALTAAYHFFFVPLTIGLGLILAINETRYYRSRNEKDAAAAKFWVKIFTATFVIGVATGITMEFSFGTNWADYSRFVGDIFGAPLAAEALLGLLPGVGVPGRAAVRPQDACRRSSTWCASWLGVVRFRRSRRCGSSSLTRGCRRRPARSSTADGSKAVITDFLARGAQPVAHGPLQPHGGGRCSSWARSPPWPLRAWYLIKGRHADFAMKTMTHRRRGGHRAPAAS